MSTSRTLRTGPTSSGIDDWNRASSRDTPASTGMSKTRSAASMPVCGRPGEELSTFTARIGPVPSPVGNPVNGQTSPPFVEVVVGSAVVEVVSAAGSVVLVVEVAGAG